MVVIDHFQFLHYYLVALICVIDPQFSLEGIVYLLWKNALNHLFNVRSLRGVTVQDHVQTYEHQVILVLYPDPVLLDLDQSLVGEQCQSDSILLELLILEMGVDVNELLEIYRSPRPKYLSVRRGLENIFYDLVIVEDSVDS